MTQDIAQLSFWDAIGADDLSSFEIKESPLEYEDAFPFDRIDTDSEITTLYWQKAFDQDFSDVVPFPIASAYLRALMPEMYGVHPGVGKVLMIWATRDLKAILSEEFDAMSPTTKALLSGTTTCKEIIEGFFTSDMARKAQALHDSFPRPKQEEIVRILMDGESVSLSAGAL